jgi:hypothetical protein
MEDSDGAVARLTRREDPTAELINLLASGQPEEITKSWAIYWAAGNP